MSRLPDHVRVEGAGTPIVLVHGSWSDGATWAAVVPDLARDHLVVTYDRRGHSANRWPHPVARRTDEDDLADLVEALGHGPVHLVGNSYGASIALGTAARRPDLVRSVIAHEPPLMGAARPGTPLGERVDRLRALSADIVSDVEAGRAATAAQRFVEDVALGPGAWDLVPDEVRDVMVANAATFTGMLAVPGWDDPAVPDPAVSVVLTDGTDSPAWLRGIVDELCAGAYAHAQRTSIDGAGHVPHLTHPVEMAALVRRVVAAHDGHHLAVARPADLTSAQPLAAASSSRRTSVRGATIR